MAGVTVITYGIGNVKSVLNACRRAGAEARVAGTGDELVAQEPDHIVLPGVGALGQAMANLRARRLDRALNQLVIKRRVPFLGICVGMQMLAEAGEEFGEHDCLGWIPGRVRRLGRGRTGLRLPHVGWNTIESVRPDALLDGLSGEHFYFLHSYALDCPEAFVVARADYGGFFAAAVRRENIVGVQFHPEKSSLTGTRLLGAFFAD